MNNHFSIPEHAEGVEGCGEERFRRYKCSKTQAEKLYLVLMETPLLRYRLTEPLGLSTRVCAIIIAAGGIALSLTQPFAGVLLIAAGIFPFLYFKCLEIDLYKGTYCEGVNLMGFTIGHREPFPGIKCIFLKKNRTISGSSRYSWSPTTSTSFDGYLWLEDGTKILLSQDSKKERAMLKLQPFAEELQTEIRDLTAPLSQV
ncbi:hypothetical protein [Pontibacter korlensis]|nr:hypothetical protein [Pontibacter korlensis]